MESLTSADGALVSGRRRGYGYWLGEKGHLVFTHGAGLQWMVAQLQGTVPEALAVFHQRLRFGVWRDGAVIAQFSPLMGAGKWAAPLWLDGLRFHLKIPPEMALLRQYACRNSCNFVYLFGVPLTCQ